MCLGITWVGLLFLSSNVVCRHVTSLLHFIVNVFLFSTTFVAFVYIKFDFSRVNIAIGTILCICGFSYQTDDDFLNEVMNCYINLIMNFLRHSINDMMPLYECAEFLFATSFLNESFRNVCRCGCGISIPMET